MPNPRRDAEPDPAPRARTSRTIRARPPCARGKVGTGGVDRPAIAIRVVKSLGTP